MNSTIVEISNTTTDMKVLEIARSLVANRGKLFRATFTKKDNSLRTMEFTVASNWNALNGIETTPKGIEMVRTKIKNNMATVCEKLEDGKFQCRTLPLEKVISLEIL